jgi:shikimate dehydrogenase
VIGDPIAQSKSPLIHGFWLDSARAVRDVSQVRMSPPKASPTSIASRRDDPDWRGCNVTMPHKIASLDHRRRSRQYPRHDRRDQHGRSASADGALIGTNTDAAGFYAPLAELDLEGAPVAVVGAGGAARAILFALARANVGPVTILNRSPLKAMGLLATFGLKGDVVALECASFPPVALARQCQLASA